VIVGHVGKCLCYEGQRGVSGGSDTVRTSGDTTTKKCAHLRPTTTRIGSRSRSSATRSAPAGRVALKTAFWRFACVQAVRISCTWTRNSWSSILSASSRMMWRTLLKKTASEDSIVGADNVKLGRTCARKGGLIEATIRAVRVY
jgi:hypothetical protein